MRQEHLGLQQASHCLWSIARINVRCSWCCEMTLTWFWQYSMSTSVEIRSVAVSHNAPSHIAQLLQSSVCVLVYLVTHAGVDYI